MPTGNEPDVLSQALAEPSRRAILECLRYGKKSVGEIVAVTERKQPNISNHLGKMRSQGLVRSERIGRQVYYSLSTPFAELAMRLHEFAEAPSVLVSPVSSSGHSSPSLSAEQTAAWEASYFQFVLTGEEGRALTLVNRLLAAHVPMETIYMAVFGRTLRRIGEMYVRGETDEAHEHLASAITERMMTKVAAFYTPILRLPYRAILGCVAGNWHSLGLRMLADGLQGLGWEIFFLGANVPTESFLNMVEKTRPQLVLISCTMEAQWGEAEELLRRLEDLRRDEGRDFQIALGGSEMTRNHLASPAHAGLFSAADLPQFLVEVRERYPVPAPAKKNP